MVALVGIALMAIPWAIPGFSQTVGDALGGGSSAHPLKVADPVVLPPAPNQGNVRATHYLTGQLKASGPPIGIVVPRLQVNSPVVPITGQSGTLTPPSDPQMLGWWLEGPQPGSATGSALLTGHTVHTGGGALDHLESLVVGDHFKIRTAGGVITYVVTDVRNYTKGALAQQSQSLFRTDGDPRVVLVTCSNWTGTEYLDNTVVTGAPIAVHS